MSPSSKKNAATTKRSSTIPKSIPVTTFVGRDGLGAYTADPAAFPSSRVVYHNDKFVVINDLFPKASIHVLLLPRDPSKQLLHPFEAFDDPAFLTEVQSEARRLRSLVAKELKRKYGKFSVAEQKREESIEKLDAPDELLPDDSSLPPGRDWSKEIISGIHIGPSMNHLHIHVLSRDQNSECMRHRKHYNSFQTPFLIDVEDFPLNKDDDRKHYKRQKYLDWDLKCWRCGKNFGNKFARLKEHLTSEFEEWKRE